MRARGSASRMVDFQLDLIADLERTAFDRADVKIEAMQFLLRVLDLEAFTFGDERAAIADLAAGLGVERSSGSG